MQVGQVKVDDFRQLAVTRKRRPSQALSSQLGRKFITLSVHLCLQHFCRDRARRAGSPATADTSLFMVALCNRETIYIFALQFLSFFPRLISAAVDRMSTIHGVALVRIQNAGLKSAARGSLQIQDAKKSPSGHHRTPLSGYIFANKARIDNRKKPVKQQYLLHMSS